MNKNAFFRSSPWDGVDSDSAVFQKDGIPQNGPDRYFDYRLDLLLEADDAIRSLLGLTVDFRQKRKLTQFLLGYCDLLEMIYNKYTGILLECRFQVDFSDRISIVYSTRMCGSKILLDGKQERLSPLSPQAIDDLRQLMVPIWEEIREWPIWEMVEEEREFLKVRYAAPDWQKST